MEGLLTTIREVFRYRGGEGQLAWIGHRIGGLGTLLFFIIHVIDTSWAYFWPEGYVHALELYRSWPFLIGELILVLCVVFHAVNGVRITIMDLKPELWRRQRELTYASFVIAAVIYIPAALLMATMALQDMGVLQ